MLIYLLFCYIIKEKLFFERVALREVHMNVEDIIQKTLDCYRAVEEGLADKIAMANRVVELNIKLVSRVLSKYKPYTDDQFQIGCMGLINASRTYQLNREIPFAGYAAFCIERAIQKDYNIRMASDDVTSHKTKKVYLDEMHQNEDNDGSENSEFIADPKAEAELEVFIQENDLSFVCEGIIKPLLLEISSKGPNAQTKINIEEWRRLEFLYIMDLVFIDSQKQRITFSQVAAGSNVSIQNIRTRHAKVMDELFQRMWTYMNLSFNDLFIRIRQDKKVPERLLVFDPGKTTGWCLFEKGHLSKVGHLESCYDDNNIDTAPFIELLSEIKPDFVLYEDYRVYAHKLERHTFNPVFTLRLIGAIEAYVQINKISAHKQMAVTAKNFVTDDKLKQWGFYQSGMKHARDAIRHACYFLLFYKKGEDIL